MISLPSLPFFTLFVDADFCSSSIVFSYRWRLSGFQAKQIFTVNSLVFPSFFVSKCGSSLKVSVKVGDLLRLLYIVLPPKPALRETGTLHLSVGNWYTLGGEGSGDVVIIVSGGMKGGNQFKCRKSQNSFSAKRPHSFKVLSVTAIPCSSVSNFTSC
jgi:hypothetical protein